MYRIEETVRDCQAGLDAEPIPATFDFAKRNRGENRAGVQDASFAFRCKS